MFDVPAGSAVEPPEAPEPLPVMVAGRGVTLADDEPAEFELSVPFDPPVVLEPLLSAGGALGDCPPPPVGDEPEPDGLDGLDGLDGEEPGGTVATCGATVALAPLLSALVEAPLWIC
ncbi:MAG: hypothetical protein QOF83_118 [Solirubrobacteraceae bacterium]|jgi:hypothetical protein|nr:hypothetical protein [Solirubrobacteraceae bacterium]